MGPPAAKVKMPTSATRTDNGTHRQRGFTLIELLVVFALLGLLVAVAPPAYEKLRASSVHRSTLSQLMHDLRLARAQARARGQWTRFDIDLQQRQYHWQSGTQIRTGNIPAPLELRVSTGDVYVVPGQSAAILFSPDGGSSGGQIDLLRPSGDGSQVRIDWLTGDISLHSLRP